MARTTKKAPARKSKGGARAALGISMEDSIGYAIMAPRWKPERKTSSLGYYFQLTVLLMAAVAIILLVLDHSGVLNKCLGV